MKNTLRVFVPVLFSILAFGASAPLAFATATFDNPNYIYSAVKTASDGTFYKQAGLSPDGTKIVAQKSWNDGTYNRTEVVLMNADGTGETIVSPGNSGEGDIVQYGSPFWSDDGTAIGFLEVHKANFNKVVVYNISGGARSYIYEPAATDVANPDFLGDSTTSIVFWAYGPVGGADLFTWDGATSTNITNTSDYKEYEPVSNSDGTKIVYWSGETTAESVNTTHTLTYSGGGWTKDVGFTPIANSSWAYWTTPAATQIALTVVSTGDISIYTSDGATLATDLSGSGYSGGAGAKNFFGSMPQGPNGEFVVSSNAYRSNPAVGRDIFIAAPRTTLYVSNTGSDSNPGTQTAPFATIQKAITEVATEGTINVGAGTYTETIPLNVDKNLTIIGAGKTLTTVKPANNDPTYSSMFRVTAGTLTMSDLKIDGDGYTGTPKSVKRAIRTQDTGNIVVNNLSILNMRESKYEGYAFSLTSGTNTISNTDMSNIARVGVFVLNPTTQATVTGSSYTGKGEGDYTDNAYESNNAVLILDTSTATNCKGVAATDGSEAAGVVSWSAAGAPGGNVTVTNSSFYDNKVGVGVGINSGDTSHITISESKIFNNSVYGLILNQPGNSAIAINNWWGNASGPLATTTTPVLNLTGTGDAAVGNVTFTPWYINPGRTVLNTAISSGGDDSGTITITEPTIDFEETTNGGVSLPDGTSNLILDNDSVLDFASSTNSITLGMGEGEGSVNGIIIAGDFVPLSIFMTGDMLEPINLAQPLIIGGEEVLVEQAVQLSSGTAEDIVLTNSELPNVSVSIPDDTTILAPSGWDGTIMPPTDVLSEGAAPSGFSVGDTVIEVGSPDMVLLFDKAVKITLTGVTGTVGYKPAGPDSDWKTITTQCTNADDHSNIVFPGECYFPDGGNTIIWTYHFTSFGEFIPDPIYGCMDHSATNYNSSATSQTGVSCTYPAVNGSITIPAIPATPAVPGVSPAVPATSAQGRGQVLGAATYNFTKALAVGSRGAEVSALQQFLIDNGFSISAGATGYYGAQTRAAVVAFQKARGIDQAGVVGPLTRAELNKGSVVSAVASGKTNLTASQADAIISIIESFGADASVVAKVRASLGR